MTFRYFEVTPKIIRPIIPVILKSSTKVMLYSALIDSGADYCIFSIDTAKVLSIKLYLKDKVKFIGVGEEKVTGFLSNIEIKTGDKFIKTKVIFANISDFGHGILGQQGFFDHYDVKLSYRKRTIEIVKQ